MRIVFTGPAKVEGSSIVRRDLIEMAERAGWQVQGMVARNTDLVVASNNNFKGRRGRKLAAADRMGVRVVVPKTFIEMVQSKRA